jgi:hypothetical protein
VASSDIENSNKIVESVSCEERALAAIFTLAEHNNASQPEMDYSADCDALDVVALYRLYL